MATTTTSNPTRRVNRRKQSVVELCNAAFALTHRMHALDKTKVGKPKGDPARAEIDTEVADLRKERDRIVRELERRAGER